MPGGRLMPNDQGLFDMLGNVYEWCQEQHYRYPERGGDTNSEYITIALALMKETLVSRGGSFNSPSAYVRSANRYWFSRQTVTSSSVSASPGLTPESV